MPRRAGRSADTTRRRLLEAGVEVLSQRLKALSSAGAVVLPVASVLAEANRRLAEERSEDPPFTTGAIAHAFGGRAGLSREVLLHSLGLEVGGSHLAQVVEALPEDMPVEQVLDEIAVADHANMTTENELFMQQWLLALAHAPIDFALLDVTTKVYEDFDAELVPLYAKLGQRQGREPAVGLNWSDVAAAMTAVAEGLAIRHVGDASAQDRTCRWAVRFRRALWQELTEPRPSSSI